MNFVQGRPLFTAINKVSRQYEYLCSDMETDVVIVGGGVTGAILAYYFSRHNINCAVLERKRIGHCSTSITTSLLQYELDSSAKELVQYTSLENIIKSYKLGIQALEEIKKFVEEHGNKCDFIERDTLLYTSKKLEKEQLYDEYKLRKENGLDVEFIEEDNSKFSFDIKGGILCKNGGIELDPFKFTHHLLEVAIENGAKIYENTEVIGVKYNPEDVEVLTEFGHKVKGKIIIVATGYNTKLFTDRDFGVKTTTFNIASKPVKEILGWPGLVLIRDNEDPYNYLRTTVDNRIIIGGEDISFIPGIDNKVKAREKYNILAQRLKNMFPEIKDIEIEYEYCGAFASTKDNIGFLGKDPKKDKLWYCLGYGANGILFSILGGVMLTKLYLGENVPKELELFRIDR